MKYLLYCIVGLIVFSSCSKIELNDDSIIGIWENSLIENSNTDKLDLDKEEWIFNDVYLGRYHQYKDGEVIFLTDFTWSVEEDGYVITYPGTELPNDFVILVSDKTGTYLKKITGSQFAKKLN